MAVGVIKRVTRVEKDGKEVVSGPSEEEEAKMMEEMSKKAGKKKGGKKKGKKKGAKKK